MRSFVGLYRRTSLMSSSLLLLFVLFVLLGEFVDGCTTAVLWLCYFSNLFKTVRSIPVSFLSSFFSMRFINVYLVHPYSCIDTATPWKTYVLICRKKSDFHMIDSLPIKSFLSYSLQRFGRNELWESILLKYNKLLCHGLFWWHRKRIPFNIKFDR